MEIIRHTRVLCPVCLDELDGCVEKRDDGVYLVRCCPRCGVQETLLSRHPRYHGELDRFYFGLMDEEFTQRDYLVRLTEKCNLNCPICLASANSFPGKDLEAARLLEFAGKGKRLKIDLMAAEPTMREDLPEIIRGLKKSGHIAALHTNGLKLADRSYLKTLIDAGLDEVHLQLDGFDDGVYVELRGEPLAAIKMKALENLEYFGTATDLVMVIKKGLNEDQIPLVFDYALKHRFVRELFFLGLRSLGKAREKDHPQCLTADDTIDIVAEKLGEGFSRQAVFRFQKLYFALISLLRVPKCLYVQHYLILRKKGGSFIPAGDWFNWAPVEKHLDALSSIPRKNVLSRFLWFMGLCFGMLSPAVIRVALDLLKMRIWSGFDLRATSGDSLIIGYITACDPFIYDTQVARYCGKGEISTDLGINTRGADANVNREKMWKAMGEAR